MPPDPHTPLAAVTSHPPLAAMGPYTEQYDHKDTEFFLADADDPLKRVRFDVGQVTPGATRVLVAPDADGTLALQSDLTGGTVTSVAATAPVASSGGTAPTISMAAATASVNGYMTATYAAKLDGVAAGANNYVFPYTVSDAESNSTVAQRTSNGYLFSSYFNGSGTFAITGIGSGMVNFTGTSGSDTYGRSYTAQAAATALSGKTMNIAGTATTLIGNEGNWASYRTQAVANMLGWKNYGNGHVIFDASAGTSPTGSAVGVTNPVTPWTTSYPTLMGWNGASTFGVRVDSARLADTATTAAACSGNAATATTAAACSGNAATVTNGAYVNAAQTFTASQRGTVTTDNDLSFDLNATNNFKCTPTAGGALTFTNIAGGTGQSGSILFINGSNYAITAAANTKVTASLLATISVTGTYLLGYFSDGTNVYVATAGAFT